MIQGNVIIEVERRHTTGKNEANRLRAADLIPAVIYGGGREMETLPLSVPRKSLLHLFRKGLHENAIFQLKMKGTDQQRHVMIRDLSVDPITRQMLHVDFVRILMDKKLRVKVGVEIVGVAAGVRIEGGILNTVVHELEVECLPTDIPASIKIDVTELKLHDTVRLSDVAPVDKVKYLDAPDRVILHVGAAKAEEVVAAVAEAVPGAPEPEVIKKGKKEEEADAEAAKAGAAKPGAPKAAAKDKK